MRRAKVSTEADVSLEQVTAFRLARHHLDRARRRATPGSIAEDMAGAHGQVASAGLLSIAQRGDDLQVERVSDALWKRRELVRVWCMRRTLHLVPSELASTFVRGTAFRAERETNWALRAGMDRERLEELLGEVVDALAAPQTREELARSLQRRLKAPVRRAQGGGWGSRSHVPWLRVGGLDLPIGYILHLAGARGVICLGPARGAESTYVRAGAWLPDWKDTPRPEAEVDLLRRYLRSYGPATPEDYTYWTGIRATDVRAIWQRTADEISWVRVLGQPRAVLSGDLDALLASGPPDPEVRLLPLFDAFILGHPDRRHLVDARHHAAVYRPQGWVAPVVLAGGRVLGVWSLDRAAGRAIVRVTPFGALPRGRTAQLRRAGRDLAASLGMPFGEIAILPTGSAPRAPPPP